jgi:hypothetical protein
VPIESLAYSPEFAGKPELLTACRRPLCPRHKRGVSRRFFYHARVIEDVKAHMRNVGGWPRGLEPVSSGATMRRHRLPWVATSCKIRLSTPNWSLAVADRFSVLRAGWCQEAMDYASTVSLQTSPASRHIRLARCARRMRTGFPQPASSRPTASAACATRTGSTRHSDPASRILFP